MKIEIETDEAFHTVIRELRLAVKQLQQEVGLNGKKGREKLQQVLNENSQESTM